MPADIQPVIMGWRGVMVESGLKNPSARGLCGLLLAGSFAYAAKYPRRSFDQRGQMRDSMSFLLMPVAVGAAVCLFT